MGNNTVIGINPSKTSLTPSELAKIQEVAPQYYQYLMNPDAFDMNSIPGGLSYVGTDKHSGYNIDYDSLRTQLQQQAQAKATADAATAKTAADAAAAADAAKAKHTADIGSARDIALRHGDDIIKQWGLDANTYNPRLTVSIDDILNHLGDTADPYSAVDGSSIANQILNMDQTTKRNEYTKQADNSMGLNYGHNLIDSHLLDSTINDILGTQQTGAQDFLDRGMKRGIYNDVGYNAGEKSLQSQASAGKSQLGSIANSVLDGYRTKADGVRDNAYSAASNYTLGHNFNLDDYLSQGNEIKNNAQTYGAGDVQTALGGTNFFDFSGLNTAAGIGQGATNMRDSGIADVLAQRKKQALGGRGLGTQGAF